MQVTTMSSSTYEPVPTTDEPSVVPSQPTPKPSSNTHRLLRHKSLLAALLLTVVALLSFKAGEWSVERQPTQIASPGSLASQTHGVTPAATPTKNLSTPTSNLTDMTGGKYSVG
jgi:hypothetical protein